MITEIVYFDMKSGTTREKALELYRTTAPAWSKNSDLIQKYYFYDQNNNRGGGVYIWKDIEAANRWHGGEYVQRIKEVYGSDVEMIRHDILLVVDNQNDELIEPEKLRNRMPHRHGYADI